MFFHLDYSAKALLHPYQPSAALERYSPTIHFARGNYFGTPLRASSSAPRTGSITLGLTTALGCSERRLL